MSIEVFNKETRAGAVRRLVKCPACDALPGAHCITKHGAGRGQGTQNHPSRTRLAEAQFELPPAEQRRARLRSQQPAAE